MAKTGTPNRKARKIVFYIVMSIFTLLLLLPFFLTLLLSFKDNTGILMDPVSLPDSLDFSNYTRAIETLNPLRLYKNTGLIVLVTMAIEMVITFMSAVALTRMVFKTRKAQNGLYFFLLLGLAIPIYILMFPIYRMTVMLDLKGNFMSLVLPYIATSVSFNTLLLTGFLREFPTEIEEAAIIDGCGLARLCAQIICPIVKPVLITVFIFNVLYIWNEFPLAVTLISEEAQATVSLGISMFKGRYSIDYGATIAASLMIMAPQIVFYGIFQKYIVQGITAGAVKG